MTGKRWRKAATTQAKNRIHGNLRADTHKYVLKMQKNLMQQNVNLWNFEPHVELLIGNLPILGRISQD
jgi:hypothetical protein